MSIDLTGIKNTNFYTEHYLATYFEASVKQSVAIWKEAADAADSLPLWRQFRNLGSDYHRLKERHDSCGNSAERCALVREFAEKLVVSLGYEGPYSNMVEFEDGFVTPIFHVECESDGAPRMYVIVADNDEAEEGILSSNAFDSGELMLEEDNEAVAGRLFFEAAEAPRFILFVTMTGVALLDRNKWSEKACMEFDLHEIYSRKDDGTCQATCTLLAKSSLCPAEGPILLDEMDKESHRNAQEVSDSLKYALREAIEILGNEVLYDWVHNKKKNLQEDPIDEAELTIQCLRYMYRMLFLLFMEARPELGFAPMTSDVYRSAYSLESLRDVVDGLGDSKDKERDTYYFDDTLGKACDLVYGGYPENEADYEEILNSGSVKDVFMVPPLKAHIFDRARTYYIRDAKLRDSQMIRVVELMSLSNPGKGKRRERISYGTLGINQLGAVYEALLSYRGFIAKEDLYEVKRAGEEINELEVGYFVPLRDLEKYEEDERARYNDGQLRVYPQGTFIYRLAGREREKSASYYTPECLTECLVRYALKELLQDKTANEILELTVCEPAMGSAAFLNEAVSQLAEAYIQKKQEETGLSVPYEKRDLVLQRVKMFIADRNVYGVDLNPIAVELGEVSLWLNTISQDGHVPWFGNQLHNGNSLIGARRQGYTEKQLTDKTKNMRWYNFEPTRIGYETGCSKSHRVYHFLVGDPGMSSYGDKVIKQLEPDNIKAINSWSKQFTEPYTPDQIKSLRTLSYVVDELWQKQIDQQRTLKRETQDRLGVWPENDGLQSSVSSIRKKDALYSKYYLSEHEKNAGPYARLKFAMDYWCALWFWPIDQADELPTRDQFLIDMSMILNGTVSAAIGVSAESVSQKSLFPEYDPFREEIEQLQIAFGTNDNTVDLDMMCRSFERFRIARDIAQQQHFFHWELEFADIFEARGGFDLTLGNPPWVKLGWKEQDVLADMDPRFVVKRLSATQTSQRRADALSDNHIKAVYFNEYEGLEGIKNFLSASQNYLILRGQKTNLYKCFLPQAWSHSAEAGVFAFVHPDGHFDDSAAGPFRRELYPRLKSHFQFENELNLFVGTNDHGRMRFSLSVYSNRLSDGFDSISNLYTPNTIEECYQSDGSGPVPGIKDENGNWNTQGHKDRIVHIGQRELEAFSILLGYSDWKDTPMLVIHAVELMAVLIQFSKQENRLRDCSNFASSMLLNETIQQQDGTMEFRVAFPDNAAESIYSAPYIGIANPVFQGVRAVYSSNNDYDSIDLTNINESFYVRTKYQRACSREFFSKQILQTSWGERFDLSYRLANREFVGCSSERTLQGAILAPGQTWVNTIFGWCVPMSETRVNNFSAFGGSLLGLMTGCYASLPYDYYVRANGKGHVNYAITASLPVPVSVMNEGIILRALLLNCLTNDYENLWHSCWSEQFTLDSWAKVDKRLGSDVFSGLKSAWNWRTPLRTDYERRQALIELDVLVSMALGLTFDQLEAIYRLDFSVLQNNESDTWYDQNGRIAFSKKSLGPSKFTRKDFNEIKDAKTGTFNVVYADDTLPGGPHDRTVEYVAPFDKCDRVEDYRTAWEFFTEKYGLESDEQ